MSEVLYSDGGRNILSVKSKTTSASCLQRNHRNNNHRTSLMVKKRADPSHPGDKLSQTFLSGLTNKARDPTFDL